MNVVTCLVEMEVSAAHLIDLKSFTSFFIGCFVKYSGFFKNIFVHKQAMFLYKHWRTIKLDLHFNFVELIS